MKKNIIYVLLFCIILFVTCDTIPTDILSFTVNGKFIELTRGHRGTDEIPLITNFPGNYYLISAADIGYGSNDFPNEIVFIENIPETAEKAFDEFGAFFYHREFPTASYYGGNVTVVIDTFGDIGEYCTGTFFGTFTYPDVIGKEYRIENGYFNVMRIDYSRIPELFPEATPELTLEPTPEPTMPVGK